MSGRGRGRGGRGSSFNREQLNAMGAGDVLPGPLTEPPVLFPPLERKPVPLTQSVDMDYMLILKQDFTDNVQMSGAYLKLPEQKLNKPQQEIDKLVAQLPNIKQKFDWRLFPSELRPKALAKRATSKVIKNEDIQSRLNKLEEMEEKSTKVDNVAVKGETEDNDEADEENLEFLEDEDEEMDDGTDYANNYFDNGESYEDEDDTLDDGPIY